MLPSTTRRPQAYSVPTETREKDSPDGAAILLKIEWQKACPASSTPHTVPRARSRSLTLPEGSRSLMPDTLPDGGSKHANVRSARMAQTESIDARSSTNAPLGGLQTFG